MNLSAIFGQKLSKLVFTQWEPGYSEKFTYSKDTTLLKPLKSLFIQ